MPPEQLNFDLHDTGKAISFLKTNLQNLFSNYRAGAITNTVLAYQASHAAWEILISIGSIHGYMLTPSAVADEARRELDRMNYPFERRLRPVSERIADEYPDASQGTLASLQDVWLHALQDWRFSFQARADADQISFSGYP